MRNAVKRKKIIAYERIRADRMKLNEKWMKVQFSTFFPRSVSTYEYHTPSYFSRNEKTFFFSTIASWFSRPTSHDARLSFFSSFVFTPPRGRFSIYTYSFAGDGEFERRIRKEEEWAWNRGKKEGGGGRPREECEFFNFMRDVYLMIMLITSR